VTRDGVFTLYDVSGVAPGVLTFDIASGPDGDMWFTGPDGLGRITPNGQASVVPVPGASVWKVTGGPDGNIWFTDRTGKIGRVTPRGDVKEFDLPAGQTPDDHDG
jgi:streptogramin lyase